MKWYTVKQRRVAHDDRAQTRRQPHRSRRSEQPVDQVARVSGGQELIIPRAPATLAGVAHRAHSAGGTGGSAGQRHCHDSGRAGALASTIVYKVKRGDTLFSIAELFDTTVAKLKSWNQLRGNALTVGTRLKIVGGETYTLRRIARQSAR